MIYFGRYTRCITALDAAMKGDMLPLNPLTMFHKLANVVIKGICFAESQLCTRTELFPRLQGDIVIPSEVWTGFAQMITVQESDMDEFVGQASELKDVGSTACNTNLEAMRIVNITESSETVIAKPLNKYIQKMILAKKMPVDTTCLRRSTRTTGYDGFKVNLITDVKKTQSKVKPRGAPSVACSSKATDPCTMMLLQPDAVQTDELPPPTPIQQLQ
jgi:hypothetical protein